MSRPDDIALDDASAGMVLAADLVDGGGAILVPRGATLTDSLLGALRRRGVERCAIVVDEEVDTAGLERERQRSLQRLERLFRHTAGMPGSALLLARLRDYRNGATP